MKFRAVGKYRFHEKMESSVFASGTTTNGKHF